MSSRSKRSWSWSVVIEKQVPLGKRRVERRRAETRTELHVPPVEALGLHYGRYLVVGDITANCHPQKRNGPDAPLLQPRGISRLLGASPTSRNVGFTTGARRCSSPLQLPLLVRSFSFFISFFHRLHFSSFLYESLSLSLSRSRSMSNRESGVENHVRVSLSLSLSLSLFLQAWRVIS